MSGFKTSFWYYHIASSTNIGRFSLLSSLTRNLTKHKRKYFPNNATRHLDPYHCQYLSKEQFNKWLVRKINWQVYNTILIHPNNINIRSQNITLYHFLSSFSQNIYRENNQRCSIVKFNLLLYWMTCEAESNIFCFL